MNKNKNKIFCLVQARMSSTRLPNKVMLNLEGKPVIEQLFHQLSFSKLITECVLTTSIDKSDDVLYDWAMKKGIPVYRGNLNDVLDRYYNAAKFFKAKVVVRITGDCPLIDPEIVDDTIKYFLENGMDYVTNDLPPTFPDGLDTEVFTFKTLEKAFKNAKLSSEREHVTPYILNNKNVFKTGNFKNNIDLNFHRWTLDNKEDYLLISSIYEKLFTENNYIKMNDVLDYLLNNPDLIKLNTHIKRNEGFEKSLKNDKKIK